jgi:molybdopterin-guanine dinucleotide biosynthesis protein A
MGVDVPSRNRGRRGISYLATRISHLASGWVGECILGEMTEVLGLVLVGGQSRRMGRPKQTAAYKGSTLAEAVVRSLRPHVEQVVLAGSGPVPAAIEDLVRISDAPELRGPMAGVLAALRWSPESAWLVAACDMPWISSEAVAWLLRQRHTEHWAILPRSSPGQIEALFAFYEPQALRLVESRAAAGRWGLRHLVNDERVLCPTIPEKLAGAWRSVNTLEELRACSEKAP